MAETHTEWPGFMTRKEVSQYLREIWGFRLQPATLAKWFSKGSDGPLAYKAGRAVIYPRELLDIWAERRLGKPKRSPLSSGERFSCPGCRQPVTMVTCNRPGTPFTSRYRKNG